MMIPIIEIVKKNPTTPELILTVTGTGLSSGISESPVAQIMALVDS